MSYCIGCDMDMWEYSEEEQDEGWCMGCAPELYGPGGEFYG
jgi:hypothetical protein